MKRRASTVIGLVMILILSSSAIGEEIKPLDRGVAVKILEAKGYTDVVIGAIVEGTSLRGTGGPSTAMVFAIARHHGQSVNLQPELLVYDREIGWCDLDIVWNHETNAYLILLYTAKGPRKLMHDTADEIPTLQ
jgi:hypothetical protein